MFAFIVVEVTHFGELVLEVGSGSVDQVGVLLFSSLLQPHLGLSLPTGVVSRGHLSLVAPVFLVHPPLAIFQFVR